MPMPPVSRSKPRSAMQLTANHIAFAQARDLLQEGLSVRIRVCGQSMLPFFRSGSEIVLRPVREEDFRPGRVVLGETPTGHFVVHRIYRVEGGRITLLGDGNTSGTETMPRERIYGTVDCGRMHLLLARLWQLFRPFRRYPLALLRRISED